MSSVLKIIWLICLSISSSAAQFELNSHRFHKKDQNANIPKLTSIQTVYGDVYDCIDVNKQLSLTHPALKDHKIKMIPPQGIVPTLSNQTNESAAKKLWKLGIGCPERTIPIRRTRNKIDQKINLINNSRDHDVLSHSLQWNPNGIDFAGLYTKPGKRFYTATANINIYNPKLRTGEQYSSAVIFVEGGGNQIQAGWTVNPKLYGDYRTRLYSAWTRDNHQTSGCFNMKCPGFIAVSHSMPLDYVFNDISKIEGQQFDVPVLITLDPKVGWWLAVGPSHEFIGYWPVALFNSVKDHADSLRFGGQVFTPSPKDNRPQMGSGIFINGEYDRTCYMQHLRVADETHSTLTDVDNSYIGGTDSRCYYEADQSFKNQNVGYSLFGGAGGKDRSTCLYA